MYINYPDPDIVAQQYMQRVVMAKELHRPMLWYPAQILFCRLTCYHCQYVLPAKQPSLPYCCQTIANGWVSTTAIGRTCLTGNTAKLLPKLLANWPNYPHIESTLVALCPPTFANIHEFILERPTTWDTCSYLLMLIQSTSNPHSTEQFLVFLVFLACWTGPQTG